jgi:HSP20 family protein
MIDQNESGTAIQGRETKMSSSLAPAKEAGHGAHNPKGTSLTATGAAHQMPTPFAFMKRIAEDMDRLLQDFEIRHGASMPRLLGRGRELFRREAGLVPADWSPQIDVKERGGKIIVRADLPGVSKDDVQVEIRGGALTIQGERRQESKEEHEGCHYSECSYGSLYRSITLPEGIEPASAEATFRNGVLEITMPAPKEAARTGHRLTVRS